MTFSHPNFNFMGCYTGQGVFFPADLFFLSQSFHSSAEFTAVSHYYSVMFHLIFCHLRTHRHFRNTKAQHVPGTTNMWHMSGLVHFNTEYFTLDRVEFHENTSANKFCAESLKLKNGIFKKACK